MNSRLAYLMAVFAAVALVAVGCGGDDDEGGDSDATTTEQTTTQSGGGSGGGGDLDEASEKLCDVLRDQPEVSTSGSSPEAAVEAAEEQVAYYEKVVAAIDDLPEPDDSEKATALRKFQDVNNDILQASKDSLEVSRKALDDPAAAAQDAEKLADSAKTIADKSTELSAVAEDLDLGSCGPTG